MKLTIERANQSSCFWPPYWHTKIVYHPLFGPARFISVSYIVTQVGRRSESGNAHHVEMLLVGIVTQVVEKEEQWQRPPRLRWLLTNQTNPTNLNGITRILRMALPQCLPDQVRPTPARNFIRLTIRACWPCDDMAHVQERYLNLLHFQLPVTYKSNRAMNSQCWKICNANPPTSDIVYSLLSGIERKEKWNYEAKCILETNLNSESFLFYCFFRNSPALPPAEKESHSLHLTKLLPVVNLGIRRFQQEWTYFQSVFNTSPILTFCDILGMCPSPPWP